MTMKTKSKKKIGIQYKLITNMMVVITTLFCTCSAFAADPLSEAGLLGSGGPLDVFYNFTTSIGMAIGALGLVMCAFAFFMTNERGMAVAKKSMFYIGLAVAVIMLIPNIYKVFATGTLKNMAWNPSNENRSVLIENADTRDTDLSNIDVLGIIDSLPRVTGDPSNSSTHESDSGNTHGGTGGRY